MAKPQKREAKNNSLSLSLMRSQPIYKINQRLLHMKDFFYRQQKFIINKKERCTRKVVRNGKQVVKSQKREPKTTISLNEILANPQNQ